jgi:hypothetical protein
MHGRIRMTISRQEEIIATLWIIASVIAFGHGFKVWGWIFAIKGGTDTLCSIYFGIQEVIIKKRQSA